MRKIKLVNKERFEAVMTVLALIAILIILMVMPKPKSPVTKWHDAIENGKTWAEYVGGEINVD